MEGHAGRDMHGGARDRWHVAMRGQSQELHSTHDAFPGAINRHETKPIAYAVSTLHFTGHSLTPLHLPSSSVVASHLVTARADRRSSLYRSCGPSLAPPSAATGANASAVLVLSCAFSLPASTPSRSPSPLMPALVALISSASLLDSLLKCAGSSLVARLSSTALMLMLAARLLPVLPP